MNMHAADGRRNDCEDVPFSSAALTDGHAFSCSKGLAEAQTLFSFGMRANRDELLSV